MKPIAIAIAAFLCLAACTACHAATDGLDELNAQRARQGLYPFQRDEALTVAAMRCADVRAARRIAGHCNDFAYLPAGAFSDGAGCGAASDHWGWLSCFMDDRSHAYAGAAWARGPDGQRYMHLFVSRRPNGPVREVARAAVKAATHPIKTFQAVRGNARLAQYAAHDPRGYPEALAVFTAGSGRCAPCNAMKQSGLLDRMRGRTRVLVFDVDRPLPPNVNRQAIRGVPRILLYRGGRRMGDWSGYSPQIDAQVTAAIDQKAAQPSKGPSSP